ncbi:ataxin-1-like isoform X1 [Pungitius pungitius]|uniref:ataxin-1-like isoform X1 n=1 Tax=Pungitius pungitius TaxID=134920 RepID=UPI002E142F5E
MSFTPNSLLVPERDKLPLKKRDQRPSAPSQQRQQQCDDATFKVPYPYKGHGEFKTKHTGPFQPVPRRVPALYQPWTQTHSSAGSKPHEPSAFRDHRGWAEWRQFNPPQPGWAFPHHYQHRGHSPGASALHLGHPHLPSRFGPVPLVAEGLQRVLGGHSWEQLKALRCKSWESERQGNGRNRAPYARRRDRAAEAPPRDEKDSPPSLSTCLPPSPHEDLPLRYDASHKSATVFTPASGYSFIRVSPEDRLGNTHTSMKEDAVRCSAPPSPEQASSSSSSSPNNFPWLLPHFVAGSLIELGDGRLRKVEHLQTEDFLLGSLACPDLRLSCCTVQSISPSASSSSISRLLILLHDQQSQELVDVYAEYPFFVREAGWSSCSPQKTARLCGLTCRQLSAGDVCLALTPVSASHPPPSATLRAKTSPSDSVGGRESPKASWAWDPRGPERPEGGRKEAEAVRRRHSSAPELRSPGD